MDDDTDQTGDTGFDDAEEIEFDSDWQEINMEGRMELTQDWVEYLAQTDPPANVDGVDTGIADYDDGSAVAGQVGAGQQEANYA